MDIKQFSTELFARGARLGFSEMEVYYQANNKFNARVFKGEIDSYSIAGDGGLAFRGIYGGKMGNAYTELIDESSIDMLLDAAKASAELVDSDEEPVLFGGSPSYQALDLYAEGLAAVTPEQKIEWLKALEAECFRLDARISQVQYCMFQSGESEIYISNTKGLSVSERSNFAGVMVMAVAREGDDTKSASQFKLVRDFAELDHKAMAKQVVEEAVSYLGAEPVASGLYPILLRNDAAADLLGTFARAFYAENAQKGRSQLAGKVGQKVAGENITLIDDPFMAGGGASRSFDSEGVATRRLAVVEKGVLTTLLHNLTTAKAEGVESTGHGAKPSYKGAVATAPSNFYIQPGTRSLEQMAESMGEGIIVTSLQGLHSGANAISGAFSLAAHGYLVEGGRVRRPVNQITVAGNFFEVLGSIVEVGADLDFGLSMGGYVGAPSLWVKSLSVGGK